MTPGLSRPGPGPNLDTEWSGGKVTVIDGLRESRVAHGQRGGVGDQVGCRQNLAPVRAT